MTRDNAWERRGLWSHTGFFMVLGITAILQVIGDRPIEHRVVGCGLAAALGAFYALVGRRTLFVQGLSLWSFFGYFVPAIGLLSAMLAVDPVFFVLLWVFYPQIFAAAPNLRWGAATAAVLSGVWVFAAARWSDTPFSADAWWSGILQASVGLMFAIGFGWWIIRIIDESSRRADLIDELASTRAELAAAHRASGVAAERERLAGEIHDTLAQGFTSIVMLLQAADAELGHDTDVARRHLASAQRTARENLAEARALVAALQPVDLQTATLPDALQRLTDRCREDTELEVALHVVGERRALEANEEIALLRAAQEALSNIRKHARARRVRIELRYGTDATTLLVVDDGSGFDAGAASGGFGLKGLRSRVELVGGSARVVSHPGHGTTVTVSVP